MALSAPTLPRRRASLPAQLRLRVTAPLYRNGYALIAGSAITSVLGLAFWVIAARTYTREGVGIGAALIAAMTLLANLAQLNLKSALNRFLPCAGDDSRRLVLYAYGVAGSLAAVAAAMFVAGLDLWAPDLAFVRTQPLLAAWFVLGTVSWTAFVLQDSILAGIRQAAWVPVENGAYAVAKIGVLAAVATAAPVAGVFLAWSIPVLAAVVAVNVLLFRRLLPRHVRASPQPEVMARGAVRAYWAADAAAYLAWAGTIGVLPLVVLGIAGPGATADFSIAWSIAYSLYLVSSALGMSLLTEGARDPGRLAEDARRTQREALRLVVPAVVVIVLAAPLLLRLLGDGYADGVAVLRLLALSAVPYAVTAVRLTRARVERHMRVVVAAYGALCLIVLATGVPLLELIGVQGLGIAWLAGQIVVAAGLVGHGWLAADGDALARRMRRAEGGLSRLRLDVLARLRWWSGRRTTTMLLRRLGDGWRLHARLATDGEAAVATAGRRDRVEAVIKRARTPAGDLTVARQRRALLELHADPRVRMLLGTVPRVLADGTLGGRRFVAESAIGGVSATALGPGESDELVRRATVAITLFHRATRRTQRAGDALAEAWIDTPIAKLARIAGPRHAATLRRLSVGLHDRIDGRRLTVCLTHGDLCPENLLVDPASGAIAGIVDWEHASWLGSPDADLMHLRLTTRARTQGRALGAVVVEALEHGGGPARGCRLSERTAVLLAWLQHAAAHADRSARSRRAWRRRNVDPVLEWLAVARPDMASRSAAIARRAAGPALVTALAVVGLAAAASADPGAMSDGGLLTVLPPAFFVALALLSVSFAVHAFAARRRPVLLGAHILALVALLHATPIVAYGTLRYSWAWKHVGIVDFISRREAVDPGTYYQAIYHYWPGFFGADAMATEVAGLPEAIGQAMWAPPVFQLLNVGALVFVLGGLTRDARVKWTACWLMLVIAWVGQDYFSPQAFALFLYLVLLGVVVRWLDRRRRWALGLALLLMAGITVTHPLTAVMAVVALLAATVVGCSAYRSLPLLAGAIVIAWDFTFAWDYVTSNIASTIDTIGLPWATTNPGLARAPHLSPTQLQVAAAGRAVVVAAGLLAAVGGLRMLRRRDRALLAPAAFAATPLSLFAFGNYEGEVLFRIYLFALPFVAFLAAQAFLATARRRARAGAAFGLAALVLLAGFVVAYYGKDRQFYFSPAEVAASRLVYEHAPRGALLIEGTRGYPGQFRNYERLDYVTISREPPDSQARVLAAPARRLWDWATEPARPAAYVIITRSQKAEVAELGVMPPGSLDRIERALTRSRRFRTLVRNDDAVVFVPVPRGSR